MDLGVEGVFVAGGRATPGGRGSDDAAIIDIQANNSTIISKMPYAMKSAQCVLLDNHIYAGQKGRGDISIYSVETKSWESKALTQQKLQLLFKFKNHIYVITEDRKTGQKLVYELHNRESAKKIVMRDNQPHSLILFRDLICN